jgi:hypothetical protein
MKAKSGGTGCGCGCGGGSVAVFGYAAFYNIIYGGF